MKIRDYAAVIRMHAGTVRIEDTNNFYFQFVLAMIIEAQGFPAAFSLVITTPGTDWIDSAAIVFHIAVFFRITINFGRGRLQKSGLASLRQAEHVDCAMHARLGGLNQVELVVNRARRTGQVIDLVDLHIQRKGYVVGQQLEARVTPEMRDIVLGPGKKVVDAHYVVVLPEEVFAQMGAEKAAATGYQNIRSYPIRFGRAVAMAPIPVTLVAHTAEPRPRWT
jgi:hypothetical protein